MAEEPAIRKHTLLAALAKVKELVPVDLLTPLVAIVCGSGLSTLGSAIKEGVVIPYTELPGFLTSQGTHYRPFEDGQGKGCILIAIAMQWKDIKAR